jgi:D-sedoheptulose 7-phosphate isomerase
LLGEEIGKQDQYIAALGGVTCLEFQPDGRVTAEPHHVSTDTLYTLEENLLLFFTGYSRSASRVLQDQNRRTLRNDPQLMQDLHELKEIAFRTRVTLEADDLHCFGQLLHQQWEQKKKRSSTASNAEIDRCYALALENGALGGKLVGAGGGGFLMLYSEDKPACGRAPRRVQMDFSRAFLAEVAHIAQLLDVEAVERVVDILTDTRARGGRLFVLGVGGSAGNASHAVNDFRKLAGIEAYAPTDNVSELTARTNDEGWPTVFEAWLRTSRLKSTDTLLVLSVGGGSLERNVSPNLVAALRHARQVGARTLGIVGRGDGYAALNADACVVVPTVNSAHVTAHAESFQGVLWHLFVSHPKLKAAETKWESLQ